MRCDHCGQIIQGTPQIFSPEVGSGVAADIRLCPGYCRPVRARRTAAGAAPFADDDSRSRS
ncbi:hypothetical protein ACFWNK_01710 [Streptomyces sp. NPDC058417]|uniref:hypothetical protein n=1 Tax=unclassified Streptomyces TaxID=2593676 RepID=UPI0036616FF5